MKAKGNKQEVDWQGADLKDLSACKYFMCSGLRPKLTRTAMLFWKKPEFNKTRASFGALQLKTTRLILKHLLNEGEDLSCVLFLVILLHGCLWSCMWPSLCLQGWLVYMSLAYMSLCQQERPPDTNISTHSAATQCIAFKHACFFICLASWIMVPPPEPDKPQYQAVLAVSSSNLMIHLRWDHAVLPKCPSPHFLKHFFKTALKETCKGFTT